MKTLVDKYGLESVVEATEDHRCVDSTIQPGDTVVIRDGSYSLSVINGKLKHESVGIKKDKYKVMSIGCKLPTDICAAGDVPFNDIVLLRENGEIVFSHSTFCDKIPKEFYRLATIDDLALMPIDAEFSDDKMSWAKGKLKGYCIEDCCPIWLDCDSRQLTRAIKWKYCRILVKEDK